MGHDLGALRERLVSVALEWQEAMGVAPHITSAVSELDAARLLGCSDREFCGQATNRTAVSKGHDFIFGGKRYQVKANRPSGKPGSFVTLVAKPKNFDWDFLIWILYDTKFHIQEAWMWEVSSYQKTFEFQKRISPADMRRGRKLV